ncbi:MAG: alpha-ketoglutarate-dependent dioxygenase AlkB [Rhizobiales bacterium]|nr:alpha-ketoglutarate-dependent dioxygenase AlkB [Hyphomicrobiales bacterium]
MPGHFDAAAAAALWREITIRLEAAPPFQPTMPRTGRPFSVRMSNCGSLGWVSDRDGGYRYEACHPLTGRPWPAMPEALLDLWRLVAPAAPLPEACLVNLYAAGSRLGLHVDADEEDFGQPVVSVSLGDDAWFRIGGPGRRDPTRRVLLRSGDVLVMGGKARRCHHGIDRILAGTGRIAGLQGRCNLTLRRVRKA